MICPNWNLINNVGLGQLKNNEMILESPTHTNKLKLLILRANMKCFTKVK